MRDTYQKLSPVTVALHWIVAVTMIFMLALGLLMHDIEFFDAERLHTSIGVLIFFVILLRVAWRLWNGWPTPVGSYSVVEQKLARLVHWTLIVVTLLLPISGMLLSTLSGEGFGIFGLELVAANPHPSIPQEVVAHSEFLAEAFESLHAFLGWVLMIAIGIHLLGGLKHHFLDGDGTLRRMLGDSIR